MQRRGLLLREPLHSGEPRFDAMARAPVRKLALVPVHSLTDEVAQLRDLDLKGLRVRWKGLFRSAAPTHLPRHLLIGVLAYRLQANAFGDLPPETVKLLSQFDSGTTQTDAERLVAQHAQRRSDLRAGTILTREWNGRAQRVMVMADGFAWNGASYDSLSAVAFAITGTRWNGHRFFGFRDKISAGQPSTASS